MKIVVLNECFLSEKNLADLRALGDLELFSDTYNAETAIARMQGKDIVLADMYECPLTDAVLKAVSGVKLLCTNTTGFEKISLQTARAMGIAVANTPGFSTEAVAEHVFALLLSVNRHIVESSLAAKASPFQINPGDKSHFKYIGMNLLGKTMGIIGTGAIGSHAAKIARGFGMNVLGYNRSQKVIQGIELVNLDKLLALADVLCLTTAMNDQSKNLIDRASIAKMKDGVIVVSIAHGGCIVSKDLANALNHGKIKAVGLDDVDDWSRNNPLFANSHAVITPHSGWFTLEALKNIGDIMTKNVLDFTSEHPRNIVS